MADLTIEDLEWLGGRARLSGRHGDADIGVPADKLLALVKIARRSLTPPPAAVPGLVTLLKDARSVMRHRTGHDALNCPHGDCDLCESARKIDTVLAAHNAARLKGGE